MPPVIAADWQDQSAGDELVAVACSLPPIFATFGFEMRLGAGQRGVDLGVGVERAASAPLRNWFQHRAAADRPRAPAWRTLARFAAGWAGGDADLASVPFVFLEFDCEPGEPSGLPSLFIALDHGERAAAPNASAMSAANPILRALRRRSDAPRLARALDALPSGSRVLHLGAMLSRRSSPLRLSVSVPRRSLAATLGDLGLSRSGGRAAAYLRRFTSVATLGGRPRTVQVDVDVASEGRPALGFTLRPRRNGGWDPILRRLEDDGLCDPAKAATLRAWAGMQRLSLGGLGEPVALQRYISHVKLAWKGDGLAAKAYIGATPIPPE